MKTSEISYGMEFLILSSAGKFVGQMAKVQDYRGNYIYATLEVDGLLIQVEHSHVIFWIGNMWEPITDVFRSVDD